MKFCEAEKSKSQPALINQMQRNHSQTENEHNFPSPFPLSLFNIRGIREYRIGISYSLIFFRTSLVNGRFQLKKTTPLILINKRLYQLSVE